jgi:hypothetical protein
LTLRTQLALARLAMAEGHGMQARDQLAALIPRLRLAGVQTAVELPQALQSLGEAELSEGHARQAVAPLQEAVSLLEQSRDSTSEAVARERLGEVLAAGGGAGARQQLLQAVAGLTGQLGAAHSETLRGERALRDTR